MMRSERIGESGGRPRQQALRLSPFDSLIYIPYLALAYAHFFTGRFEEATLAASRCEQANPRFSPACQVRIAATAAEITEIVGSLDDAVLVRIARDSSPRAKRRVGAARFASDSPLEQGGFEPLVPLRA
jgi:hypothetical protein